MVYLSISALSGRQTLASIGFHLIGDLKISQALAYLFGAGGITYGYRERKLRRDKTEYLATRNAKLEQKINPSRTSSNLTTRGTTSPEDEL